MGKRNYFFKVSESGVFGSCQKALGVLYNCLIKNIIKNKKFTPQGLPKPQLTILWSLEILRDNLAKG